MFNISEKAANEIKKLLLDEDDKTMFLGESSSGGCSGFEYEMDSTMSRF